MMAAIKCPICKNRKSCEIMGMGDSAIQSCGMYCTDDPPRRSNGDVFRAMTDEELAKTMSSTGECPPCKCPYAYADLSESGGNITGEQCMGCWLDWLKQPVAAEEDRQDGH